MRLAMVVRDGPSNPAARVRALAHVDTLESCGHEVRTLAWNPTSKWGVGKLSAQLISLARWADVVFLQRPNQPPRVLDLLKRTNDRIVVDFDDALWASSRGTPIGSYGSRLLHAVRSARHVTPGSEYLAGWVREVAPGTPITVVRPAVDLHSWPLHQTDRDPGTPIVLGWIGTASNLTDFDRAVVEAIGVQLTNGRVHLRLITAPGSVLNGVSAEVVKWSAATEAASVASLDIGLMPLQDTERSRGRCGYKAIQYLAAGIPVVASPVGSALEIVQPNETGLLASSRDQWLSALTALVDDPGLRESMGIKGRRWVETNASSDEALARLLRVFEEVAG